MEDNEQLSYRIERSTKHGTYVALVELIEHKKHHIELYKGTPYIKLFGITIDKHDPIDTRTIGPYADVNQTITKMIIDHELPFYQKQKAQEAGHHLEIDYEEELRKKQPQPKKQKEEETIQPPSEPISNDIIFNDWRNDKKYVLTTNGKTVPLNSIKNLKQFQTK